MKKTWIKVKRGLLEQKHRKTLGIRVFLYLYILDIADWEAGTINGWTDKAAAKDLGVPHRTVQLHRQQLEAAKYISCEQGFQCLNIKIHNWTDPRKYDGRVINVPHPFREVGSPSFKPHKKNHIKDKATPKRRKPKKKQHPAIEKFRKVAGFFPASEWHSKIKDTVGEEKEDLRRWKEALVYWIVEEDKRPTDYGSMLKIYKNGKPQDMEAKRKAAREKMARAKARRQDA